MKKKLVCLLLGIVMLMSCVRPDAIRQQTPTMMTRPTTAPRPLLWVVTSRGDDREGKGACQRGVYQDHQVAVQDQCCPAVLHRG